MKDPSMRHIALALAFASSIANATETPKAEPNSVYTLYRSSAITGGDKWRLHVATFDSSDGAQYNRDNCEIAKSLFQSQPGVTVTYWCERGYFSKQ